MGAGSDRFGGVERLYGPEAFGRFAAARVMVVGVGGVGSWAAECLARSGIGSLVLVDLDEICLTNVNRQLHAMDGQIGRQKCEAMAERMRAIHPGCVVDVVPRFFNESSAAEILDGRLDVILDAIDSTAHKALLIAEGRARGMRVVTCGGAGGRKDPTRIRVADLARSGSDPLLQQVRRRLRRDHGFPKAFGGTVQEDFGIDAVFSDEAMVTLPCTEEGASGGSLRPRCATGLGTAGHVTGAFGLVAAGRVLERLAQG
jgi:tRNA A37 threonylcarbamoyladenosine dehydratase